MIVSSSLKEKMSVFMSRLKCRGANKRLLFQSDALLLYAEVLDKKLKLESTG